MKKEQKKIRVEFEIPIDKVKRILEAGAKGPKKITKEELEELSRVGVIRASDYLDEAQAQEAATAVTGWLNKLGEKAVTAAASKAAQEIVLNVVEDTLAARSIEELLEEDSSKEDKPKE
ncbi:MAG: hypothetical protein ACLP7A_01990 [Desulfobaccales bacterium]